MQKVRLLYPLVAFLCFVLASHSSVGQPSPWGTGSINNLNLGQLSGQSLYTSHTANIVPVTFDLNNYLANYTFNIYIPASYDGTEPYGVVTYINSGNTGGFSSTWIPVLDEKKLILVAGNNIGNNISVVTRIGVAFAGSEVMKETLNIDTTRVYASGNSGGARSCGSLMFFFPEKFNGMLANCGSSYLRLVDQDYETYQLNSHYEYGIFLYNQVHLDYVNSFDRKYAMMTSFDDFREGDIMNIYHNGMEPDGFKSKILEVAGFHCTTSGRHLKDAINFVEHPHIDLVRDSFAAQPVVGNGFQLQSASIVNQQLRFDHNTANEARAYSNDPFLWNDEKGAIIRTSIHLDSATYQNNSVFNIGLLDLVNPGVVNEQVGQALYDSVPNLLLSIAFNDSQPTVFLLAENPAGNIYHDTLFVGTFADWSAGEPLPLKYHIWDQEVRVEFGKHFDPNVQVNSLSKLLDDNRSVRVRTDGSYWLSSDFVAGSMLTFYAGKLDTLQNSTTINVDFVEVIVADTLACNPIAASGIDSVQTCGSYLWLDGITYTSNNNTATHTLTTSAGCDSIVTLNLTINTPNTGITSANSVTLTANAAGATYQWLDCDNGYALLPGEINQSFTATVNGNYAVQVTENGCVDTSACLAITNVGLTQHALVGEMGWAVYPNPSTGQITVDLQNSGDVIIILRNMLGEEVSRTGLIRSQLVELSLDGPAGIYVVEVITENGERSSMRVIKK